MLYNCIADDLFEHTIMMTNNDDDDDDEDLGLLQV